MSTKTRKTKGRARSPTRGRAQRRTPTGTRVAIVVLLGVLVLGGIFSLANRGRPGGSAGKYAFQVGRPGPGEPAPAIRLMSTAGGSFDLSSMGGKNVLLYFQEGIMCQPCWTQMQDIERQWDKFRGGVDAMVSITTYPLAQLKQKVADERLRTPVLADPDLAVSKAYDANSYGMMGLNYDGHTFVLVGPDGKIRWRADYGGPPNHTMYVPPVNVLADLHQGLSATGARS